MPEFAKMTTDDLVAEWIKTSAPYELSGSFLFGAMIMEQGSMPTETYLKLSDISRCLGTRKDAVESIGRAIGNK